MSDATNSGAPNSSIPGAPLMAGALAVVLLVLIGLGWWSAVNHSTPEISLPILALAGIVGLLLAVAFVAVIFRMFDLSDKSQALGLPDGSVRAIIALSLLVLFAILSVFLYVSLSSEKQIASGLSAADQKKFTDQLTPEQRNDISARVTGANASDNTPTYSLYLRDTTSQARQDIAKQLLGIIGTLLSAIAGFYFGANTVSSMVDATARKAGGDGGADSGSSGRAGAGGGGGAGGGAGAGGNAGAGGGGGAAGAGTTPQDDAAALKALNAVTLPQSGALTATPAAVELGQDPRLASESDPQKQNLGIVS